MVSKMVEKNGIKNGRKKVAQKWSKKGKQNQLSGSRNLDGRRSLSFDSLTTTFAL